ncbi:TKL protein kinase [Saprolegnia diclina VS20]|uniref:TKL protein kinase n=1 Tax=Saprolegnia diclina (strain VS20) TaxID=1156394 RepID=T0R485_SAPDV|nr:TKL protein kinase [Saprolegnia diclina VS20]EQC26863.1 TKL protein kinase [Saprolegnia diclina VS20]|eukprot:XP_008619765.1 TKL protein kinase [Saprolegnia diclina VS20]
MDTSIPCVVCNKPNVVTENACTTCGKSLGSDADRLDVLVRRLQLWQGDPNAELLAARAQIVALQAQVDEQASRLLALQAKLQADASGVGKDMELKHLRERLQEIEERQHLSASLHTIPGVEGSQFLDAQLLGTTSNFVLHLGTLEGKLVVRKMFFEPSPEEALVHKFKESIAMLAKLDGGGGAIIPLFGAAAVDQRRPVIFMEYMERGDLRSALTGKAALSWPTRLQIALQVAKALAKMHAMDLIHRDLNSSHILLSQTNVAKVTGLSNAREKSPSSMTNNVGDFRWAAPETMVEGNLYSEKADIYSFGIILVELDTHELPYAHMKDSKGRPMRAFAISDAIRKATPGAPITQHKFCDSPSWYQELARECTSLDPTARPSAVELVRRLQEHLRAPSKVAAPPTPAVVNVRLTVVEANSILDTQAFGTQSPICKVGLGGNEFSTQPHNRGGRAPRWNERFDFFNVNLMEMVLEANILNVQWWLEGQIGKCNLPLHEALDGKHGCRRRMWLPVYSRGDNHGYLTIDVEFQGDVVRWLTEYVAAMECYVAALGDAESVAKDEALHKIEVAQRLVDQVEAAP